MDPSRSPSIVQPRRSRVAVRVTDDAVRWVRAGHPWVFADSVVSEADGGRAGDLAVVFDRKRRFRAIGLYDPTSPIRVRVLHHGDPTPIDEGWWRRRFTEVIGRRRGLLASTDTTGLRCVNGENDGLGGLVVDRYADVAVVKIYTPAWVAHLDTVVVSLVDLLPVDTVVLRLGRRTADELVDGPGDGTALYGDLPTGPVLFRENGLVVEADVIRGQKTGWFLDQRDNRRRVGAQARGARVLDVFSAAGGFALNAAAGGARAVLAVDASAGALAAARRNFDRNRDIDTVRRCRLTTRRGDAFAVMDDLAASGERFDIVVVDPPSFAQRAADVPGALRAYGRLTRSAVRLVTDGGLLVQASCSARVTAEDFHATVAAAARAAGVRLDQVRRTGHADDHPIGFDEGAYLKALFARVRRDDLPSGRRGRRRAGVRAKGRTDQRASEPQSANPDGS